MLSRGLLALYSVCCCLLLAHPPSSVDRRASQFGDLFEADMATEDPFREVETAIAGYYECQDRPQQ